MQQSNTFAKTGKDILYNTTNNEYGSGIWPIIAAWAQDGIRP